MTIEIGRRELITAHGNLYCVAQDEVIAFDFGNGECPGLMVQFRRLHPGFGVFPVGAHRFHCHGVFPDACDATLGRTAAWGQDRQIRTEGRTSSGRHAPRREVRTAVAGGPGNRGKPRDPAGVFLAQSKTGTICRNSGSS